MNRSEDLGQLPIPKLLFQQAVPASIGFLIMSIYGIVDTIFVGRWVGALGIAAITVVMPITFLISSIGMGIGIGGASIISRALGGNDRTKAFQTFGNQATLTFIISFFTVCIGSFFQEPILKLFGGHGNILPYAKSYFQITLYGIPFLAWSMMSNNVMRSQGAAKMAMLTLLVPAFANIILDPIFIVGFGWGIEGAGWATSLSYVFSAFYTIWYFSSKRSELKILPQYLKLKKEIVYEIFSIGGVSFARQGVISLLAIILNNSLIRYGGETSVSVYGIINRMMMFTNFPVIGITQGFIPIAGFNIGSQKLKRVKQVLSLSIKAGTIIAFGIFLIILLFAPQIVAIFTNDEMLLKLAPPAIRTAFLATPLLTIQLVGSAYFQASGKAIPALLLTLTKQGFCLIPLIFILPPLFGINGIWYSFPIADVLSATITFLFLRMEVRKTLNLKLQVHKT